MTSIAYLALITWPVLCLIAGFLIRTKAAVLLSIFGAYLLLPVGIGFDLPIIPKLDKYAIGNLIALLLVLVGSHKMIRIFPKSRLISVLVVCLITSPLITTFLNQDNIIQVGRFLRGYDLYSAISGSLREFILFLPFVIGYALFRRLEDQRMVLFAFCIGGLIYALPILTEVRLSPQLHTWIYGFFPHSFAQQVRFGGYRPVVFIGHGLLVAMFLVTCLLAAVGLWRSSKGNVQSCFGAVSILFFGLLILSKGVAAILYGLLFAPFLAIFNRKIILNVLAFLAIIVLLFPALRWFDLVPVHQVLSLVEMLDDDRARSLAFRFNNEDRLLAKASEKPVFGWGGLGRNRVYDVETGQDISITDGTWIIFFGIYGWYGYLARFGLMAIPVLLVALRYRHTRSTDIPLETVTLCTIMTVSLIDLLPNASTLTINWLIAGVLVAAAGEVHLVTENSAAKTDETQNVKVRRRRYAYQRREFTESSRASPVRGYTKEKVDRSKPSRTT